MGSVVLDAVNTLFGHSQPHPQYQYPDTAPSPSSPRRHSRSIRPNDTSMSAAGQRTPGAANTPPRPTTTRSQTTPHATSERARPPPRSPPLAAISTPSQHSRPSADPHVPSVTSSIASRHARPKIKVRDLEHIQSFAREDMNAFSEIRTRSRSRSHGTDDDGPQYEISGMKVEHIIEMVAGLLTKITTTNDQQHEHLHRQSHLENAAQMSSQTNSVLAFHGKNVPSISILSYLSRINKYCPTSYEVFLSLLVYFDRMTERVNAGPMQSLRQANEQMSRLSAHDLHRSSSECLDSDKMDVVTATTPEGTQTATPPSSGGLETVNRTSVPGTPHSRPRMDSPSLSSSPSFDAYNLSNFFVVDSFNIHRLVIAGVTCASKFFSDIFYTNSRYAKVGGLPLPELNHLELQFLLLNDFRLSVPAEEIDAYGTMLVEFYAREVVAQEKAAAAEALSSRSLSESSTESTATVRAVA